LLQFSSELFAYRIGQAVLFRRYPELRWSSAGV